jgi:hypothetical protein
MIGVAVDHSALDLLIRALIVGLGGWRLASLLVHEDGPWSVFARLRRFVGGSGTGEMGFWALLLDCVWCASVWTATGLWVLWYLSPQIATLPAAWGTAIIVHRWVFPPRGG